MDGKSSVPCWRDLWLSLTKSKQTDKQTLDTIQNEIKNDLPLFHTFGHDAIEKNVKINDDDDKLKDFVGHLHRVLNVNVNLTWQLLTHFLEKEFHGTRKSLENLVQNRSQSAKLMQDVWSFYTSERMFCLKSIRTILELSVDDNKFDNVGNVRKLLMTMLKKSLSHTYSINDEFQINLEAKSVERSFREQIEITQCLIVTHELDTLNFQEITDLLDLFAHHGTRANFFYDARTMVAFNEFETSLTLCQVAFLLCIFDYKSVLKSTQTWEANAKNFIDLWITRAFNETDHAFDPVILAWTLIRCNVKHQPNGDIVSSSIDSIYRLLTHEIVKDNSECSKIVRTSIFNLLYLINVKAKDLYYSVNYFKCLGLVLKDEKNAALFWTDETLNDALMSEVLWYFPLHLHCFSFVAEGLVQASDESFLKLLELSKSLPYTCVLADDALATKITQKNNEFHSHADIYPFLDRTIRIPAGSVLALEPIDDPQTIHFKHDVSYWTVLNELINLCKTQLHDGGRIADEHILAGLSLWTCVLTKIEQTNDPNSYLNLTTRAFDSLIGLVRDLVLKRSTNTALFAKCLDVIARFQSVYDRDDVYADLKRLNLFGTVLSERLELNEYMKTRCVTHSRIVELIIDLDLVRGEFALLLSYVRFLRVRFRRPHDDMDAFEIPGVIFLMQDILPRFADTPTDVDSPQQHLLHNIITIIFDIVKIPSETVRDNARLDVLQNICVFELLTNTSNGALILNIVARGNKYLESLLQRPTSWYAGAGLEYLSVVRMSLAVLMLIFQKKWKIACHGKNDLPLESLMFNRPKDEDTLNIIQNVVSYMNHAFEPQLPVLACRLLRKFALKLQISLHGCFDMDPEQIRHIFVHRLRSKHASDSLKIAVLDFIIACVTCQPGLTQALFSHDGDNSLLNILREFLELIATESKFLEYPLVSAMMSLFHELWNNQKQAVVRSLRQSDRFWQQLCKPLQFQIQSHVKAYAQIFNIITLELFIYARNTDENLMAILKSFLQLKQIKAMVDYIFVDNLTNVRCTDDELETPSWLMLVKSWKDFVYVVVGKVPELIGEQAITFMGNKCFNALIKLADADIDAHSLTIVTELFNFLLNHCKTTCFPRADTSQNIENVHRLLQITQTSLRTWPRRLRHATLSTIVSSVELLRDDIREYQMLERIFATAIRLLSDDLLTTETNNSTCLSVNETNNKRELLLKLLLFNEMLEQTSGGRERVEIVQICVNFNVCLRLRHTLEATIHAVAYRDVTNQVLNALILLAGTEYAREFLSNGFDYNLWMLCTPLNITKLSLSDVNASNQTHESLVVLNAALLNNLNMLYVDRALQFVVVHQSFFVDTLTSLTKRLHASALSVAEVILMFVLELLKYKGEWKNYHEQSFVSVMKSLQSLLYFLTALALRPNCLQYFMPPSCKPDSNVFHQLINVIARICEIFTRLSPPLVDLLCNQYINPSEMIVLLEPTFNIPKLAMDGDVTESYDFGLLLSIITLLSKSLSQTPNLQQISRDSTSPRKRTASPIQSPSSKTGRFFNANDLNQSLSATSPGPKIIDCHWLNDVNDATYTRALQSATKLLAVQLMTYFRTNNCNRVICREVSTELVGFFDWVRKIAKDYASKDGYRVRKKRGFDRIGYDGTLRNARDLRFDVIREGDDNSEEDVERRRKIWASCDRVEGVDGEWFEVLSDVRVDFNDYFLFISNLLVSLCKKYA